MAPRGEEGFETSEATPFLRDFWYLALPAAKLRRGRKISMMMFGDPLVIGRLGDGQVFALSDACAHCGMPLRDGHIETDGIRCRHHGMKFAFDGHCLEALSSVDGSKIHGDPGRVRTYPCREFQGNIWVYLPHNPWLASPAASLPPIPTAPSAGEAAVPVHVSARIVCLFDDAVLGLVDPAHAAFVHTFRWWSGHRHRVRPKQKSFTPHAFGFRSDRHALASDGARPYRVLGRKVSTEITFQLPGVRVEHIEGEKHSVVSLTTITPLTERTCEMHQCLYTTIPWLGWARPIARRLAQAFLSQDREILGKLDEGFGYGRERIFIDDADTQAKWYYSLKREYEKARQEGRPFRNPIERRVLRYQS